jgi:hypothetical protein
VELALVKIIRHKNVNKLKTLKGNDKISPKGQHTCFTGHLARRLMQGCSRKGQRGKKGAKLIITQWCRKTVRVKYTGDEEEESKSTVPRGRRIKRNERLERYVR